MTSTVYVDVFLYIYIYILLLLLLLLSLFWEGGWEAGTVCSLGNKRDDVQISS